MQALLLFLMKHCLANYGFNSYPTAQQPNQLMFQQKHFESAATLPPLIEMPQLGGGAQMQRAQNIDTGSKVAEKLMTCPACPEAASPEECPELTCPEVICNVEKEADMEEEDEGVAHHRNLIKEEELMRMRLAKRQRRQLHVDSVVLLSNKCNEKRLKDIMMESISSNIVVSKVTIAERANLEIGGNFGVICTSGVFSYYVAARIFCEATRDGMTCFAFRQDDFESQSLKSERKMDPKIMKEEGDMSEKNMEVKPLEEPPTATTFYEKDMLEANKWLRTSTSANMEEMKAYGLYDPQTRLLLEENFEDLIAELEKRQHMRRHLI